VRASSGDPLVDTERWFLTHGLPYFVPEERQAARDALRLGRTIPLVLLIGLAAAAAGAALAFVSEEFSFAPATLITIGLVAALWYALTALRARPIVRWALHRTFGSLRTLLPMMSRALPLLLLFVTFLFINAEVWQVSSTLDGGVLWGTVLFFGVAAVLFLVPRLAEELDAFDDSIVSADLIAASKGTPLEAPAQRLVDDDIDLPEEAQVTGLQMVNLVLVLVIAQAVQVLLLAVAVFGFFMVFGAVAIDDTVIESWTGDDVHHAFGLELFSQELLQVSVFLAAFSGLYFTVYAVTDELYRREFFTTIMNELRRAVGARVVYRALRRAEPAA
jgi:hypothetical protein